MTSWEARNGSGELPMPVSTDVTGQLDLLPASFSQNLNHPSTLPPLPLLASDETFEVSDLPYIKIVLDSFLADSVGEFRDSVPSEKGAHINEEKLNPHKKRGHQRTKSLALAHPIRGVGAVQQLSPAGNTYDWVLPDGALIPESAFKETTKNTSTATVNNRSPRVKFKEPHNVDYRHPRSQHQDVHHSARSSSEPGKTIPIPFESRHANSSPLGQATQVQTPLSSSLLSSSDSSLALTFKGFRNAIPWNKTNDNENLKRPNFVTLFSPFQQMKPMQDVLFTNNESHKTEESFEISTKDSNPDGNLSEEPFFHQEIESVDLFADFELSRYFNRESDVESLQQNTSVKIRNSRSNFQDFRLPIIPTDSDPEELKPLKRVNSRGRAWTVSATLPQLC
ncbi:hypothetical protein HK096_006751 [Nowakowskiella sp. JEL0078]|nr:hypothetical protein HK096_006751 [Nowakowskiella sp. JEL0078]